MVIQFNNNCNFLFYRWMQSVYNKSTINLYKFELADIVCSVFKFNGNLVDTTAKIRYVERRGLVGEVHQVRQTGSVAGDCNKCLVAIL